MMVFPTYSVHFSITAKTLITRVEDVTTIQALLQVLVYRLICMRMILTPLITKPLKLSYPKLAYKQAQLYNFNRYNYFTLQIERAVC